MKENFNNEIERFAQAYEESDELNVKIERLGLRIFKYFLHDEFMSKARKMLAIEIYKNSEIMKLYIHQYITNPVEHHQNIINYLGIDKDEANTLAFAFYSPVYLALKICDSDPSREEDMYKLLNNTYKKFNQIVHV